MVKVKEMTSAQFMGEVPYEDGKKLPTYRKLRQMRKDPTIALVRYMFFSGIWAAEWVYEKSQDDVPEEYVDFVRNNMNPMRRHILSTGALGCFDFGWQPYEKVFDLESGEVRLKKLKPLLQDLTDLRTDDDTGQLLGLTNGNTELDIDRSLLLNFDVEGTNWKGTSTLANAEKPYDESVVGYESARRYDKKMAGAHWIVYYPDEMVNFNGQEVEAHIVAAKILQNLQSSGSVAIPLAGGMGDMIPEDGERRGWKVELITADGKSPFGDRFRYLDTQKIRALGFLERAITEGAFGTKAESESHQDFVITMIEYRHSCLLELINWHVVNQLLRMQFGASAENAVVIKNAALHDAERATLASIYDKVLSSADGMLAELDRIDIEALAEAVGIPRQESEPELPRSS